MTTAIEATERRFLKTLHETAVRDRIPWRGMLVLSSFWFAIAYTMQPLGGNIIPLLVTRFTTPTTFSLGPLAIPLDVNTYVSLLDTIGAAFAIVWQPAIGALSDNSRFRHGRRRPFIAIGVVGDIIFLTLIAFVTSYWALLVVYVLFQMASNTAQGPYQGLLPDQVPADQRAAGGRRRLRRRAGDDRRVPGGALWQEAAGGRRLRHRCPRLRLLDLRSQPALDPGVWDRGGRLAGGLPLRRLGFHDRPHSESRGRSLHGRVEYRDRQCRVHRQAHPGAHHRRGEQQPHQHRRVPGDVRHRDRLLSDRLVNPATGSRDQSRVGRRLRRPSQSMAGRLTATSVPLPSALFTTISPLWASTIHFAMASPRPLPPFSRVRALSAR